MIVWAFRQERKAEAVAGNMASLLEGRPSEQVKAPVLLQVAQREVPYCPDLDKWVILLFSDASLLDRPRAEHAQCNAGNLTTKPCRTLDCVAVLPKTDSEPVHMFSTVLYMLLNFSSV